MPEGPEIRHHSTRLRPMVGKDVTSIHVLSGRYIKTTIEDLGKPVGHKVLDIRVHGKLIGIYFENCVILSTAGMSGDWLATDAKMKFERIEIIAGRKRYVFCDQRNFGTFKVVSKQEANDKFDSLGLDIFARFDLPFLRERIARFAKTEPICESLLEQRIFAGVGNYIRAEAMYLAGINPRDRTALITDDELTRLWTAIQKVANSAFTLEHKYVDLCYRRDVADDGRNVESFRDSNGRTVWYAQPEKMIEKQPPVVRRSETKLYE